jgi:hypothetical protein
MMRKSIRQHTFRAGTTTPTACDSRRFRLDELPPQRPAGGVHLVKWMWSSYWSVRRWCWSRLYFACK